MIKIEKISKSFKQKQVLNTLSLEIETGSIIHIRGQNGCGKSTLLKIISGLLEADNGNILYPEKACIGALIENPTFIENESLLYNLRFLFNLKNKFNYETVENLCKYFFLDVNEKMAMKKYSVGMRQKAGIIQAIMEDQNIILFDEPTRGLDQETIERFNNLICILKENGKTVIICAHDGVEGVIFDKVYEMKNGKIA